jgi:hypothetical protein
MARAFPNVDVILDANPDLCLPLDKRDPDKTLFLLLTPRVFKDNPASRFHGFKFSEYKAEPLTLGRDLPDRAGRNWVEVSKRLGWLTWEDVREVNSKCCPWLDRDEGR